MKSLLRVLRAASLCLLALPVLAQNLPELTPGPVVCRVDCWPLVADFTGDGLDDFISKGMLYVNVRGAFAEPVALSGVDDTDSLQVVGDFTKDGRADLFAATSPGMSAPGQPAGPPGPRRLMINQGNGVFVEKTVHVPHPLEAFDFDADGLLDLMAVQIVNGEPEYSLWRGHGDATFTRFQFLTWKIAQAVTWNSKESVNFRTVVVADFNNDDRPDLAISSREYVSFFLAGSDGKFGAGTARYVGNHRDIPLIPGDVNGDGNVDLIAEEFTNPTGGIVVLYGDGTGHFPDVASLDVAVPQDPSDPVASPTYISSLIAVPIFGAADQIIAAFQDGTIVTVVASPVGQLRELQRTKVQWKNTQIFAGRFREPGKLDLLAAGSELHQYTDGVQIVYAEGKLPVIQTSVTAARGRGRAVNRGVTRGRSGEYEVRWSGSCAPAPSVIDIQQEGIFVDVKNAGGAEVLEMAILDDEMMAVRFVVDAGGRREIEGFLVRDGVRYVGRIPDQHRPYAYACDGSPAIYAVEITPKRF